MARPQKQGIEYFPLDVVMDDKMDLIEASHGLIGFAVVIKLFQKIYSEGYYYEWTEKEQLLFSKRVSVDINLVVTIVSDSLKWGVFDKETYERYRILTSKGIQKRYVTGVYKRKDVEMVKEYLLINVNDRSNITLKRVSDVNNSLATKVTDSSSTQSKVKESKVKESKVKESTEINDTDTLSLELCKYYSDLVPGQDISPHFITIKVWIEIYGYDWTKEAIQKCVSSKNKFIIPWIEAVLKNWTTEGKEEISGKPKQDNAKDTGKFAGFKPAEANYEDIDYSGLI